MQTDRQQIINASAHLARRFRESRIGPVWVRLKFWELLWAYPPWRVTKYQRDLWTIKCLRRTLRDARKKQNKGKTVIFRSMEEGVILSEDELKTVDLKAALKMFARLETFLAIYRLEIDLATSVIPYVELADDLDSVIGKFESEGETLLPVVEELCRKRERRDVGAFTSGVLTLLVLHCSHHIMGY